MKINVLVVFDNEGGDIFNIRNSTLDSSDYAFFEKFGTLFENVCKYSSLLLIAVDLWIACCCYTEARKVISIHYKSDKKCVLL